jgi:N-acetylglucosamine-6-sulfatase
MERRNPREGGFVEATTRPNVLLIMTDDQPYHTLGIMGAVMTRLVAQGLRFSNGYVATPVCGPARGSVLTGKWSHNTGLEATSGAWRQLVESGELPRNIARRLEAAGYACHLTGKFTNDLENANWVCPGFASWWAQLEDLNDDQKTYWSVDGGRRRDIERTGTEAGNETMIAARFTENFVRNSSGDPWFACFWPHSPHGPYHYLNRFEDTHRGERPPTHYGEEDVSDKAPDVRRRMRSSDAAESERMREYREKLREIEDVNVGCNRIMNALAETDQLENTYIFFITDNGYQFGEHNLDKKLWPYEESARTPFVVRGPGVQQDTTSGKLVSQVDLLPTICELAGADTSGVDGRSIVPLLRDPAAPWREYLLVEAEGRGWHSVRMRKFNETTQEQDNLLYIRWKDGFEELYDYENDPELLDGEINTPREHAHVDDLRQRLETMRVSAGDAYRAAEN